MTYVGCDERRRDVCRYAMAIKVSLGKLGLSQPFDLFIP